MDLTSRALHARLISTNVSLHDIHSNLFMCLDVFIASITLIRDSNKVILVDTGLATDINGRTDLLTSSQFLNWRSITISELGKLDIAPPNIDYVITTHGHPDHAGNTNDFPDAIHFQGNMLHYRSKFNFSDLFEVRLSMPHFSDVIGRRPQTNIERPIIKNTRSLLNNHPSSTDYCRPHTRRYHGHG